MKNRETLPEYGEALQERGGTLPEYGEALQERDGTLPEYGEALQEREETLPEYGEALQEREETLPERKEALMEHIERERMKLNDLIGCSPVEEIYCQSILLDGLIEQYTELTALGRGSAA